MHIEENPAVIQSWIRAKQTNEQEMLKRLNTLFNQPAARNAMRVVVLRALQQMLAEIREGGIGSAAQHSMWKEKCK